MNDIIGKTVASVETQEWAGKDTFKDDVTWERTVITFTDDTTASFDSWDGDAYDPYRCIFDDNGQPHRLVETTATCRHCGRAIGLDPEEGWIDPEAGYDDENDGIWRTTCDENHEDRIAAHEPASTYGSDEPDTQALADAQDAQAVLADPGVEDDLRLIRKYDPEEG